MMGFVIGTLCVSVLIAVIVGISVFVSGKFKTPPPEPEPPPCVHDWDVRARIYKKPLPVDLVPKFTGMGVDGYLEMVSKHAELAHGQTSVVLTCKKCGDVDEKIYPGILTAPEEKTAP